MRRADRLFQIVQILRSGRLTLARDLAERLEVSERTIYRDIAHLIGSGVPVEGEAGVGYMMREGYDLPPLMFSRAELNALVAGIRMARAFGSTSLGLAAEDALAKIETVLPEARQGEAGQINIHAIGAGEETGRARGMLDEIQIAADSRLRLTLHYRDKDDKPTERQVRPLGLWFWGRAWTLVSWCELRRDFRMFRVDRIDALSTGDPFPDEPDKNLRAFYLHDRENR